MKIIKSKFNPEFLWMFLFFIILFLGCIASIQANFNSNSVTRSASSAKYEVIQKYSLLQVSEHNKNSDCWVIINKKIYNLTVLLSKLKDSKNTLFDLSQIKCGVDNTDEFNKLESKYQNYKSIINNYLNNYFVGNLK